MHNITKATAENAEIAENGFLRELRALGGCLLISRR
jgi:hypothetical protein